MNEYWEIDGEIFEDEYDAKEYIRNNIDEGMYDDMLDDVYGDIDICGGTYSASYALSEIDPTAYRVGFSDFVYSLDIDLPVSYDGEEDDIYGCTVIYHYEEDEDEDEDEDDEEYDESYNRNRRRTRSMPVEARNRRRRRF